MERQPDPAKLMPMADVDIYVPEPVLDWRAN